jgi:hypothetical protein
MNWPRCTCDSPGWCNRHFQNKDRKQWLNCLKNEGHRHSLDFKYGILPQNMTDLQKQSVQRHIDSENSLKQFIYDYDFDKLKKTKIILLGHKTEQYENINKQEYLEYQLLQSLDLGIYKQYQNNCFAESRVFLSNILNDSIEYIGVITASWNNKFDSNKIDKFHEWENTKILFNSENKNIVLTAERSMFKHNSIFDLFKNKDVVQDFSEFTISLTGEICNFGLWANQIICHREIYLKLQEFYRTVFPLVVEKIHSYNLSTLQCHGAHGLNAKNIYTNEGFNNRKAGLFFEFLTNVWFASQKDLIILPNASRKRDWYHHL